MRYMGLNEIREKYLSFFEEKEHLRMKSFSLVPENDPSILLINAGMTPLKPYFTGEEKPPRTKVTTCQKCIRTLDIENVGKTSRHGTFFEMLGNFSFGDYFKREAINWAWEFVSKVMEIPLDKLYFSVYHEDDEAYDIWTKEIGIPEDRMVRLGKEDNFWEHGVGPCGPCSEIYFDRGPDPLCTNPDCKVGCDCDRYVEFWNLVFTQFYRTEDGEYERLANPNIDTGMGLERLACVMQGVNSLFEVDTVKNVLQYICDLAKVEYNKDRKTDISLRVITDHIRSTTMLVSDGVTPSNEGRGYVLRRLIRRAARHAKMIGINKKFLSDVAQVVINESKGAYPELEENASYIKKIISIEEDRFNKTIDQGMGILSSVIEELKAKGEKQIPGDQVFKLHDTFGFPLDLTREIAEEEGLSVDEEGFNREMNEQKEMARKNANEKAGSAWADSIYSSIQADATSFEGYTKLETLSDVIAIVKDDQVVEALTEGEATLILDRTAFYAEMGGQKGDIGEIATDAMSFKVSNTTKTANGLYLHHGVLEKGAIECGDTVVARVDRATRMAVSRNHTATHILHKALKNVLGDHVKQAGSSVDADRLRFDFSHFSAVTKEELAIAEKEANKIVLEALDVVTTETDVESAKKAGAEALFGEKYGDTVRMVAAGDYSIELCGGTHVANTSVIGPIKIVSEGAVSAGTRRIEALTGQNAINYFNTNEEILNNICTTLKTSAADCVVKVENNLKEIRTLEKEINQMKSKEALNNVSDLIDNAIEIDGVKVISKVFDGMDANMLKELSDTVKAKFDLCAVLLGAANDDKANLVFMASKAAVAKGVHCGNLIKLAAKACSGGGGGRPDMAQAGGKDASKVGEAIDIAVAEVKKQLLGE